MKILCVGEMLIDFTPVPGLSNSYTANPGADMLLNEDDVKRVSIAEYDIVHAGSVSQSGSPEKDAVLLALKTAGRYGAVSGGLCIQKPGGIPAIPTINEIEVFA